MVAPSSICPQSSSLVFKCFSKTGESVIATEREREKKKKERERERAFREHFILRKNDDVSDRKWILQWVENSTGRYCNHNDSLDKKSMALGDSQFLAFVIIKQSKIFSKATLLRYAN